MAEKERITEAFSLGMEGEAELTEVGPFPSRSTWNVRIVVLRCCTDLKKTFPAREHVVKLGRFSYATARSL